MLVTAVGSSHWQTGSSMLTMIFGGIYILFTLKMQR